VSKWDAVRHVAITAIVVSVLFYIAMAASGSVDEREVKERENRIEWCEEKVGGEAYVAMVVLDGGLHCALPPDKATFWNRSVDIPPASELNTTR
jgi:hypothetical protein